MLLSTLTAMMFSLPAGLVMAEFLTLHSQCFNSHFSSGEVILCSKAGLGTDLVEIAAGNKAFARRARGVLPSHRKKRGLGTAPPPPKRKISWTRPPVCTQILEGVKEPLCVYTSADFANGRGLSIVSTISYAKGLSGLPAFQTAGRESDGLKRKWIAKPIPGKGIGMVATESIRRGELILIFTPVLLVHSEIQQLVSTDDAETMIRKAVGGLPVDSRNAYMSLATSLDVPEYKTQDIILTNSFELHAAGQQHIAIVPEPSRMNHDCAPNAIYHFDHDRLLHRTYAVRDINAGEEITTAYANILEGREVRRANLKTAFRFDCGCDRCMQKGKFATSDKRMHRIAMVEERLEDWSGKQFGDNLGPPTTAMALELVNLYEEEGLFSHEGAAYGHVAMAYSAIKDANNAIKYAEKALEVMEMKDGPGGGPDGISICNLRDAMKDGKKHWSWGMRV